MKLVDAAANRLRAFQLCDALLRIQGPLTPRRSAELTFPAQGGVYLLRLWAWRPSTLRMGTQYMAGSRVSECSFVLESSIAPPRQTMWGMKKEPHPLVWMVSLIGHSHVLHASKHLHKTRTLVTLSKEIQSR
jgi:hypothetical protein